MLNLGDRGALAEVLQGNHITEALCSRELGKSFYKIKARARRPRHLAVRNWLLFFFFTLRFGFGGSLSALGFGLFHCLLGFFGLLGAGFGALLALFFLQLLAA
jgi:hypothetical protein